MKFKPFKQAKMICSGGGVHVQGVFGAAALSSGVWVYSHWGCAWNSHPGLVPLRCTPRANPKFLPEGGGHSVLLGHQKKVWLPPVQCLMFTPPHRAAPCAAVVAHCGLWQP